MINPIFKEMKWVRIAFMLFVFTLANVSALTQCCSGIMIELAEDPWFMCLPDENFPSVYYQSECESGVFAGYSEIPGCQCLATDDIDTNPEIEYGELFEMDVCPYAMKVTKFCTATDDCDNSMTLSQDHFIVNDLWNPIFPSQNRVVFLSCGETIDMLESPIINSGYFADLCETSWIYGSNFSIIKQKWIGAETNNTCYGYSAQKVFFYRYFVQNDECTAIDMNELQALLPCTDIFFAYGRRVSNGETSTTSYPLENLKVAADGEINIEIELFSPQGVLAGASASIEGGMANSLGELIPISSNEYSIVYQYISPIALSVQEVEQTIPITISIPGSSYPFTLELKVVRAPLLFLHGLLSNGKIWDNWIYIAENSGLYNDYQVIAPSYPNNDPFEETIPYIDIYIDGLLQDMFDHSVFCNSVDIVGHSMGPLLARYYTQHEMYSDDVNRIISINTPHHGSPWGVYLSGLPDEVQNALCNHLNLCSSDGTAIYDLRTDSNAINAQLANQTAESEVIPKAIVCSTFDPSDLVDLYTSNSMFENGFADLLVKLAIARAAISTPVDEVINVDVMGGEPHDLAVQLESQTSNLENTAIQSFDGVHHGNVHMNDNVKNYVMSILNEPVSSENYFNGPYGIPTGNLFELQIPIDDITSFEIGSRDQSTLDILSPTSNEILLANSNVDVLLEASIDIVRGVLMYEFEDNFYSQLIIDFEQPASVYIDSIVVGEISILVLGFNEFGFAAMDTITLNIGTDAELQSVTVGPNPIIGAEGRDAVYDVYGMYDDGVVRNITNLVGLSITSSEGKFVLNEPGTILCISQGIDTLNVTINGLSTAALVQIADSSAWVFVPIEDGLVDESQCTPDSTALYFNSCAAIAVNGIEYAQSGQYEQLLFNKANCDSLLQITINIQGLTADIIEGADDTLYTNVLSDTYQWLDCENNYTPIQDVISSVFVPTQTGFYAVQVSNSMCSDTSDCIMLTINSVNSIESTILQVFPNPAKEFVTIIVDNPNEVSDMAIFDIAGEIVYRANQVGEYSKIDVRTMANGLYLIRLSYKNGRHECVNFNVLRQ